MVNCPECKSKMRYLGVKEVFKHSLIIGEGTTTLHIGYRCPACGVMLHKPPLDKGE